MAFLSSYTLLFLFKRYFYADIQCPHTEFTIITGLLLLWTHNIVSVCAVFYNEKYLTLKIPYLSISLSIDCFFL